MAAPYWPNTGQVFQQLNYISSTGTLSLTPGGNSVILNLSTPVTQTLSTFTTLTAGTANIQQGNFSSIQVGGEQLLYQNIANAAVGNLSASTVSLYQGAPNIIGTMNVLNVGTSNLVSLGYQGSDGVLGKQESVIASFSNGAAGDITFCDLNGNNSALTAINYQSAGLTSSNVSTIIYGHTSVPWDLTVPKIVGLSSINGQPYSGGGGGSGVSQIVAGDNVTISPSGGTGVVTINASGGGGVGPNPSFSTITAGAANVSTIAYPGKGTLTIQGPVQLQGDLEVTGSVTADAGVSIASGQQLVFVGGNGNMSGLSSINGVVPFTPYTAPKSLGVQNFTSRLAYLSGSDGDHFATPLALSDTLTGLNSGSYVRVGANLGFTSSETSGTCRTNIYANNGDGTTVGLAFIPSAQANQVTGNTNSFYSALVPIGPSGSVTVYGTTNNNSFSTIVSILPIFWSVENLGTFS